MTDRQTETRTINKKRCYDRIMLEIVGFCNAQCRWCVTGNKNHPTGKFVDVEKYDQALKVLFDHQLIYHGTKCSLFNWGEPTLHPRLSEIIDITQNKHGLFYNLSTNAGKAIEWQPEWFKKMNNLIISMCGFSQASYDRIHKFDFEKVKSNIERIVATARTAGYNTQLISVAHHVYQFNYHEVLPLYEWTKKLNISYNPSYAFINNPKEYRKYVNNELSVAEMKEVGQDLFCHFIDERIKKHPRKGCRLFDTLTIDEQGNIVLCCAIERDHEDYRITNVFDPDFLEKLENWQPPAVCQHCQSTGMSPIAEIPDGASFPDELYLTPNLRGTWQRLLLLANKAIKQLRCRALKYVK